MEIGKHQEITVCKYSYLLTKLHIVSKMKEFAYNMLSFCMYFHLVQAKAASAEIKEQTKSRSSTDS